MTATLLESTTEGERLRLAAAGAWTAQHARVIEKLIDTQTGKREAIRSVVVDAGGIEKLDTFGAWLLERLVRAWKAHGCETAIVGLAETYRGLMDEVRTVPENAPDQRRHRGEIVHTVIAVGRTMVKALDSLVSSANMIGAVSIALLRVLVRPRRFRLTAMVHHLENVGWRAVPIILLITFLIGCIIAQQGIFHFRKFGADVYVVDMVGILVLREIGVLIVSIMVAGRSGSAYTAELGSMKMREEIDALRTMGFDPVEVLILPRILALIIGVPILTFLGSIAALYGGGLVAWFYGGIDPEIFLGRLKEAISLQTFEVGMIKAPFMALVIGIVACVQGLKVKGSAESLGLQTTASVVESIFLVIVLDGLFAIFFASIGM
ncbi:MAG TPA: MlaE family lipid ABC transporter permease subunit [Pseudolabrys sp.]|jgi:phospholipid/cholesterol/gamma-HCH transport system permease protein|nr:MlaE family lipid ABC transporter permease subunit [Pseudolabrys sp.]